MRKRNKRRKQMTGRLVTHAIIIMLFATTAVKLSAGAQSEVSTQTASTSDVIESENVKVEQSSTEVHNEVGVSPTEKEVTTQPMYPEFSYSKDWDADDAYLLAKIAMAEAEGENIQTKTLVILTVLNRVWSDEFPDTIEEVIFQKYKVNGKTIYQFSPVIPGGRWYTTEPNEDCWEAVRVVQEAMYDYSGGALYFESCEDEDNWHSRNLEFLYQSENLRFYK